MEIEWYRMVEIRWYTMAEIRHMVYGTSASANSKCNANWKLARMEFSPMDPYLKTVLGFSYGPEVNVFIPKLSGAISRYYYEGEELNSKFIFFSTYYSKESDAKEAFDLLKRRANGNTLQDASLKRKQVIWFAGRNISKECFDRLKKDESNKL